MALQHQPICSSSRSSHGLMIATASSSSSSLSFSSNGKRIGTGNAVTVTLSRSSRIRLLVRSSGGSLESRWEWLKPPKKFLPASVPCLSDILWPSAGAFAALATLGWLDQMVGPKGLSFTIAPLGAVCAVLFASPNSPAAQKYSMFVAQIGCAALGLLALLIFGPSWLARAAALSSSIIAFMIITGATHPPDIKGSLVKQNLEFRDNKGYGAAFEA